MKKVVQSPVRKAPAPTGQMYRKPQGGTTSPRTDGGGGGANGSTHKKIFGC